MSRSLKIRGCINSSGSDSSKETAGQEDEEWAILCVLGFSLLIQNEREALKGLLSSCSPM